MKLPPVATPALPAPPAGQSAEETASRTAQEATQAATDAAAAAGAAASAAGEQVKDSFESAAGGGFGDLMGAATRAAGAVAVEGALRLGTMLDPAGALRQGASTVASVARFTAAQAARVGGAAQQVLGAALAETDRQLSALGDELKGKNELLAAMRQVQGSIGAGGAGLAKAVDDLDATLQRLSVDAAKPLAGPLAEVSDITRRYQRAIDELVPRLT